jgi:hypothetical protein
MFDNPAAVWSAVAATFAALSSFLIMLIQRRNLLESVRPELVLMGWGRREEGSECEAITFNTIRNIGRGAAIQVVLWSDSYQSDELKALVSCDRIPILGPDDTVKLDGNVLVFWKLANEEQGVKRIPIVINMDCWDTRGMRHETQYTLMATRPTTIPCVGGDEVAPGVTWLSRTTSTRAVWLLKMQSRAIIVWTQSKKLLNRLRDKLRGKSKNEQEQNGNQGD